MWSVAGKRDREPPAGPLYFKCRAVKNESVRHLPDRAMPDSHFLNLPHTLSGVSKR
ncbi:MAG: hypothetical protein ACLSDJ_07960 [Butyricimonas faecihominis]